MSRQRGFTLIELIVVIAILAILAAVAVPAFTSLYGRAKQGADISSATEIANAINIHNSIHYDDKITQADVDGWSSKADVEAVLGEFTPLLHPDNFPEALDRVNVNEVGVATVNTVID